MNKWFRIKKILKEMTNKLVKHMSRETIPVAQFPDDFELDMEVSIVGAKTENSVEQTTN